MYRELSIYDGDVCYDDALVPRIAREQQKLAEASVAGLATTVVGLKVRRRMQRTDVSLFVTLVTVVGSVSVVDSKAP